MRIALLCPYSLDVAGGVGTHVLGLARWLQASGHEPLVIAPGECARITDLEVALLGPAIPLRFNGAIARLALQPKQMRLARKLAAGAEVLHVHEPLTPGVAYAVAKTSSPLVVTHHAHFDASLPLSAVLRLRARSIQPSSRLAVSDAAAETAAEVTGYRPQVVPNALALPPAPAPGVKDGRTVLFVGRSDDVRKGYPIAQQVAAQLPSAARFVAITDGRASAAALAAAYDEATCLIAPNLRGESFGMVLIEALAHGCGVVASDLPAFRQVLGESPAARWFPVGDSAAATAAVAAMLRAPVDPAIARDLALPYTWDVVGPRILAAYQRARSG